MNVNKANVTNLISGFLILAVFVGAWQPRAEAASAADFYKDKKITFIASSKAGGGTDLIVRIIAPYLKKYSGAYAVVVDNVEEAGGMLALNRIWNSKPDGLTLSTNIMYSTIMMEVGKQEGVQFQCDKFNIVFALTSEIGNVLMVNAKGPLKSIDDLKKAKGLRSACLLGKATTAAYFADLLGLDARITPGMATGNARMALIRGEIDFFPETVTGSIDGVQSGNQRPLVLDLSTPVAAIPNVPPITKFATSLNTRQKEWVKIFDATNRGKYAFAGPQTPPDRVAFLRSVFDKIFHDPQFLQERKKGERYASGVPWSTGAQAEKELITYLSLAKEKEHDEMQDYLAKKYFTVK